MQNNSLAIKLKHILIEISKQLGEKHLLEFLSDAIFYFKNNHNTLVIPKMQDLEIHIAPNLFTKNYSNIERYGNILRDRINYSSSRVIVQKLEIYPDYDKLEIVNSEIFPVFTPWEEINSYQRKLIEDLKRGSSAIDFQNLGNTSRIIMDKLSREVFDFAKHAPPDLKDVSSGKFKNQLHTYVETVLAGSKNRDFRVLAKSAIDFMENSIDLMNSTTHKLNAERHLAEVCVVSTITAVSIIKLIKELE